MRFFIGRRLVTETAQFVQIVLSIAVSAATIFGIVKVWIQKPIAEIEKNVADIRKELKLNRDMTFQTIYDRLVFLCTRYLEAGSINSEDLERLTDMYSAYEAAGGNHYAKNLYDRVLGLPIRKEKHK